MYCAHWSHRIWGGAHQGPRLVKHFTNNDFTQPYCHHRCNLGTVQAYRRRPRCWSQIPAGSQGGDHSGEQHSNIPSYLRMVISFSYLPLIKTTHRHSMVHLWEIGTRWVCEFLQRPISTSYHGQIIRHGLWYKSITHGRAFGNGNWIFLRYAYFIWHRDQAYISPKTPIHPAVTTPLLHGPRGRKACPLRSTAWHWRRWSTNRPSLWAQTRTT